jgi:peptide/nickel transport system permease protein
MGLKEYVIRRIILMIPTIIGVTLLIFAITQFFTPSRRAMIYVTSTKELTSLEEIIQKYHLNDPVYVQYYYWITQVLQGNLGWARLVNMPVANLLAQTIPATFELVFLSIPLTILVGIWLGVKSAVNRDKPIDHITRFLAIVGWSLPSFLLGLTLLSVFYGVLGWFPPGRLGFEAEAVVYSKNFVRYTNMNIIDGILNGQLWISLDALRHIILPAIVLTTINIALLIRVMRSSMLEALSKGYITMAKAKGLSNTEVINKHARRNALIPVATLSGLLVAGLMSGVTITETVFSYYGVGYYAALAAMRVDIPVVLGFTLFVSILFVVSNLVVDILYAYIDPRIRLG